MTRAEYERERARALAADDRDDGRGPVVLDACLGVLNLRTGAHCPHCTHPHAGMVCHWADVGESQ